MTKSRKKIIEQVRKLSEIVNPDSGAFEGEIANASAAMQRLMDKYSISMAEVHEAGNVVIDEAFKSKNADAMFGVIRSWHWQLARVIAHITHTKHFSTGKYTDDDKPMKTVYGYERSLGKTIGFYGKESSAELASQLFVEWLNKLTLMALEATSVYCKELVTEYNELNRGIRSVNSAYRISGLMGEHPNVFRQSWLQGCLSAVSKSLQEQEDSRTKNVSLALVVFDENLAAKWKLFSKGFNTVSSGGNDFNTLGYAKGSEVGATLHIGQKSMGGRNKQLTD